MKKMKDSGIAWVGEIPEDWEVVRNKVVLKNATIKNIADATVLSLYRDYGIIPKNSRNDNHNVTSENTSNYKLVEPGDFVINKMKAWQGSMAVSKYRGIVSPAYYVCKMDRERTDGSYIHYLARSVVYLPEYLRLSTGMRIGQWDLNINDFLNIKTLLPALAAQRSIANFLNRKCGEVESLTILENKLIEELKAYKQSLITEVVTGQTIISKDQNGNWQKSIPQSTKDSGIEWIGKIPSDWDVVRLKNYFNLSKGLNITKENLVENGYPVINYGQVHSKLNRMIGISADIIKFVPMEYLDKYSNCLVNPGGFIFADTSEDYEGCGNFAYNDRQKAVFAGYHTIIADCKVKQSCKYFAYLFQTNIWRSPIRTRVSGVKVLSISQAILRNTFLLLPIYEKQQLIAEYLDEKCSQIDKLIQIKEDKIKELNEYKKSIIYEYVTGKKEVV